MTVGAILRTKYLSVVSIGLQATVLDAVKILNYNRIGALLVMEGKAIVGILTERNIIEQLSKRGVMAMYSKVGDAMNANVVACQRRDSVTAVMEKMIRGKCRHLPVQDNDDVVGVISIGDVVKWRVREFESEQESRYIMTA